MKVNKESPSHYRLLFATSTRDGGFISLLPDFQFRHSQLHKAKHTPTDPFTKNYWIPLQHKQSSLISTIPGNRHCHLSCRKAAASGFILKPNRRNTRICPIYCLLDLQFCPSVIWGIYLSLCEKSFFKPNLLTPLFFLRGEREDRSFSGALCWPKTIFKLTNWEMRPWDASPAYICPFITE